MGGTGVGLTLGTLIAAGATALPEHRSATGSAITNSTRQLASALGVAVLVTIMRAHLGARHGYDAGWVTGAALAVLAAAASLAVRQPGAAAPDAEGKGAAGAAAAAPPAGTQAREPAA